MKQARPLKILIVAGESGGHIFPAVAFCQELSAGEAQRYDITFVSTRVEGAGVAVPREFHPIYLKVDKSPLGIARLLFHTAALLWQKKPDVVFGFGGYITVPFVVFGSLCGRKTLLHEQNVIPGSANRFLAFFASRIAVSFEKTKKYFKGNKKVFLTRYPLRQGMCRAPRQEALDFFGFDYSLFTLLVMGGSQGASSINERVLSALGASKNLSRLQVIHLCGQKDHAALIQAYGRLPVRAKVFAFLDEMHYAYSSADLVICRAGAGSVFEIMRFGLPSVLVPYPYAAGHQTENARFLAERGAALLLEDKKMSDEMLNGLLDIFLDDAMRRKTMSVLARDLEKESQNISLKDLVLL